MEIADLVAAIEAAFGIRHMTLFASFSAYLALSVMVDQCQLPTTELKVRIQSVYSVVRKLTVRTNLSLRDPLQAVERRMSGFVRDICCSNSSQEQSRGNLASEDAPQGIVYQRSNTKLIIPFTEVSQQGTLDSLHIDASGLSLISTSQVESEMSNTDNIAWFVNTYSSSTGPLGSTSWVCAAAEMSKSHPLVRDALHSVANLIRGKVSGVLELEQQGQQAYIGVLRRVNDAIGRSDECSDSLFYTVVLLSTIEVRHVPSILGLALSATVAAFQKEKREFCQLSLERFSNSSRTEGTTVPHDRCWALNLHSATIILGKFPVFSLMCSYNLVFY
jgi:hypothetical protein